MLRLLACHGTAVSRCRPPAAWSARWAAGISGPHDVGGTDTGEPLTILPHERDLAHWELSVHALLQILVKKQLMTVDELRRGVEALPASEYKACSYYERWASAITRIVLERGVVTESDLDHALQAGTALAARAEAFKPGDPVRVRSESTRTQWAKPHLRTPGYVFGATGIVERYCGEFSYPELGAFRIRGPPQRLYRVRFNQGALWGGYRGSPLDTTDIEIYEPWLEAAARRPHLTSLQPAVAQHGHAATASATATAAEAAAHRGTGLAEVEEVQRPRVLLAESLLAVLTAKGVLSAAELTAGIERVQTAGARGEGARLVARAWVDPSFRSLLLSDATAAAAQLGIGASNYGKSTGATVLTVMPASETVHHLIVCTLCSCYPTGILGFSPSWYKSAAYRARAVRDPRAVLAAFGTVLPESVALRVHDSTADLRYMVLPLRPRGTEGWSEAALAARVTRDSMIGVQREL